MSSILQRLKRPILVWLISVFFVVTGISSLFTIVVVLVQMQPDVLGQLIMPLIVAYLKCVAGVLLFLKRTFAIAAIALVAAWSFIKALSFFIAFEIVNPGDLLAVLVAVPFVFYAYCFYYSWKIKEKGYYGYA